MNSSILNTYIALDVKASYANRKSRDYIFYLLEKFLLIM